jgi:hypothetical protein
LARERAAEATNERVDVKKRLTTLLALPLGAAMLFLGTAPASASAAVDPHPSATTPDGKTVQLSEFVYTYVSVLKPAEAGDSAWIEIYSPTSAPTVFGKVTASSNTAALQSGRISLGAAYMTLRACAGTDGVVTCTAWNKAI